MLVLLLEVRAKVENSMTCTQNLQGRMMASDIDCSSSSSSNRCRRSLCFFNSVGLRQTDRARDASEFTCVTSRRTLYGFDTNLVRYVTLPFGMPLGNSSSSSRVTRHHPEASHLNDSRLILCASSCRPLQPPGKLQLQRMRAKRDGVVAAGMHLQLLPHPGRQSPLEPSLTLLWSWRRF